MTQRDVWLTLFKSSRDGMFELGRDGRIVESNPVLLNWLGLPRNLVVGRPLMSFVTGPVAQICPGLNSPWAGTLSFRGTRGEVPVSASITPLDGPAGAAVAAVGIAHRLSGLRALEEELLRHLQERDGLQLVAISAMARLAELLEPDISGHLERIRLYTYTLARHLAETDGARLRLNDEQVMEISRCAILHDVGKVAIPEPILAKGSQLSPEEWALMKTHAAVGARFLTGADDELQRMLGVPATFLGTAQAIAHWHHERWDGGGYPDGLSGTGIPLAARIVAVADVYDALTSPRVYKDAWSHELARAFIIRGAGKQFDPQVVEAFVTHEQAFCAIAESLAFEGDVSTTAII